MIAGSFSAAVNDEGAEGEDYQGVPENEEEGHDGISPLRPFGPW